MERKAKIVIPAFSVGRTQELVYVLHQLSVSGRSGIFRYSWTVPFR